MLAKKLFDNPAHAVLRLPQPPTAVGTFIALDAYDAQVRHGYGWDAP